MVITLIGYRGTGKTSVADPLAGRLGWQWSDADDAIQTRAGKSIREIFAEDGEDVFRSHEREAMKALLNRNDIVIAAGGGAVLNAQTRREIRLAGPVVWLTASVETIVARIGGDLTTSGQRPNLTASGGRQEVEQLLAVREPLYRECADATVETDWRAPEEIAEEIITKLEPRLREGAAG